MKNVLTVEDQANLLMYYGYDSDTLQTLLLGCPGMKEYLTDAIAEAKEMKRKQLFPK